jgi:hypothetical protein
MKIKLTDSGIEMRIIYESKYAIGDFGTDQRNIETLAKKRKPSSPDT